MSYYSRYPVSRKLGLSNGIISADISGNRASLAWTKSLHYWWLVRID